MRILFPNGKQKEFIEKILTKISVAGAAKLCELSERTIRDWRREKFLMQKDAMSKLCSRTNTPKPKNFEIKDDFWYVLKGAKLGGIMGSAACIKKYGCIGGPNRKKAWEKWWNSKGKFSGNPLFLRKSINRPPKSKNLAEFIGIMLGDGGFTAKGKQVQITLNNIDDREYMIFVSGLIKQLFLREPKIFKSKDAIASKISISSVDLANYLVKLGLKKGNKVRLQVDIPDWIKKKKSYSVACVRGLMDTDGCVFNKCHKTKNKTYNYKRLSFTNHSLNLIRSVYNILNGIALNPKIRHNRQVQIEDKNNIKRYFKIIGTHNPKHLKRYYK